MFCILRLTARVKSGFIDASCSHQPSTSQSYKPLSTFSTSRVSFFAKKMEKFANSPEPFNIFPHIANCVLDIICSKQIWGVLYKVQVSLKEVFVVRLKDNIPHNTCQIYVKPHSKNTQMTLESQIFDEKALR